MSTTEKNIDDIMSGGGDDDELEIRPIRKVSNQEGGNFDDKIRDVTRDMTEARADAYKTIQRIIDNLKSVQGKYDKENTKSYLDMVVKYETDFYYNQFVYVEIPEEMRMFQLIKFKPEKKPLINILDRRSPKKKLEDANNYYISCQASESSIKRTLTIPLLKSWVGSKQLIEVLKEIIMKKPLNTQIN